MPEMFFVVRWPDGAQRRYYSPSLVVGEYLEPGVRYALPEFLERSRTALRIASDRVRAKYGFACARAAQTLADIEAEARGFDAAATVQVETHGETVRSVRDVSQPAEE